MHTDAEPTGIPGLDEILGGGLPRRGIVIVIGAPGAGKTLLVQQLAFSAARAGRRALYFSSLAEPHERLVEHLRPFAFFDEGMLGDAVQFLSLGSAAEQGVDAATAAVMQTTRRAGAGLVIIDGLRRLRGALPDDPHGRGFLYRIGSQIGLLGALLVVVLEDRPPGEDLFPELAASDALVGLYYERAMVGHRRYLEVFKRRGAPHLPGLHALTIGTEGLTCYPQFEMAHSPAESTIDPARRASFGVPKLDAALGGGLTQRTATVIAGNPGTGKTAFALHFLAAGLVRGERGLWIGFRESASQLIAKSAAMGIDLAGRLEQGSAQVLISPPVGLDPDVLAYRTRQIVAESGIRRLVIDSIAELAAFVGPRRLYGYLAVLFAVLRQHGVTALLTNETSSLFGLDVHAADVPISGLFDNVLVLQHVQSNGRLQRLCSVIKMRFSQHDHGVRRFTIGERGIHLLGPARGSARAFEASPEKGGP